MAGDTLTVALVREVFYEDGGPSLIDCLKRAKDAGAELAVLPEIPLLPWSPATKESRDEDTEAPGGAREQIQSLAAREVGIALVGGTIVTDPDSGERFNTALVFDTEGAVIQRYRKIHVPEEPGFWETSHYECADEGATPVNVLGWSLGVQICSDIMRPMGSHALASHGADLIVNPRATSRSTAGDWILVCRSTAMTTGCYVLSPTRPRPEQGVELGGPVIAADPNGKLIAESEDELTLVTLERPALREARADYPGYLPVRNDVYTESFGSVR